jgi:hypothetical protein
MLLTPMLPGLLESKPQITPLVAQSQSQTDATNEPLSRPPSGVALRCDCLTP